MDTNAWFLLYTYLSGQRGGDYAPSATWIGCADDYYDTVEVHWISVLRNLLLGAIAGWAVYVVLVRVLAGHQGHSWVLAGASAVLACFLFVLLPVRTEYVLDRPTEEWCTKVSESEWYCPPSGRVEWRVIWFGLAQRRYMDWSDPQVLDRNPDKIHVGINGAGALIVGGLLFAAGIRRSAMLGVRRRGTSKLHGV